MTNNTKLILSGAISFLTGGGIGFISGVYFRTKQLENDIRLMEENQDELEERVQELWSITNEYKRILAYLTETEDDQNVTAQEKLDVITKIVTSGQEINSFDSDEEDQNEELASKYDGSIETNNQEPNPAVSDFIRNMSAFKEKSSIDGRLPKVEDPVDYRKYSKPDLADLAKRYETEHPVDSNEDEYIFLISKDEFDTMLPPHNKLYYTYYMEDDVLCDQNEEVVSDPNSIIGEDALTSFGAGPDPDTIYVRNGAIGCDYEITRYPGSYQEIVLGIYDDQNNHKNLRREIDD